MVGVLTRSMLDDGRGLARSKVFKHNHEESYRANLFHWAAQSMFMLLSPCS